MKSYREYHEDASLGPSTLEILQGEYGAYYMLGYLISTLKLIRDADNKATINAHCDRALELVNIYDKLHARKTVS